MDLHFNTALAEGYKSASQIARILTEDWMSHNMYCPICGAVSISKAPANAPVKDYICDSCKSQFELKSKKCISDSYQNKVNDGVYQTMIERITSLDNPHFFFMHYDQHKVNNLIIVPKHFFVPHYIEKRKPLNDHARRAGWTGCNILLGEIPDSAKIYIVRNSIVADKEQVIEHYNRICALRTSNIESRGWLTDVLRCTERLDDTFSLQQMYSFASELQISHPQNHNIEAKIRQQLQILRDKGFLRFMSPGLYKKIK